MDHMMLFHQAVSHPKFIPLDKKYIIDTYGEDAFQQYRKGERQFQRGQNSKLEVEVSLEDFYKGGERYMSISRDKICDSCKGTGAKDGKVKKWTNWGGQGVVYQNVNVGLGMQMKMQTHWPVCEGRGVSYAHKCTRWKGNKVYPESKTLHIVVTPGMQDGEAIYFDKDGPQQPDVIPGDVIAYLKQTKHDRFTRQGDDLYTEMQINLKEALLGLNKTLTHLDGRKVEIKSEPKEIIQPFSVKVIKGEGMPLKNNPTKKGNLHVKFIVSVPSKLSQEQKEIAQELLKE